MTVFKIGDLVKTSDDSAMGKILSVQKCNCKSENHNTFAIKTWDEQEIIWHGKVKKFSF